MLTLSTELEEKSDVLFVWYPSGATWTGGASIGLEDNQWPADPWLRLSVTSRSAVLNGVL